MKVTGYVNQSDLAFIGEMIQKHSLKGRIDLSDVDVVGSATSADSTLAQNVFGISTDVHVSHLLLPKSVKCLDECLRSSLSMDTLTFGGEKMPTIKGGMLYGTVTGVDDEYVTSRIKCLNLREGIKEIADKAFRVYHTLSNKDDYKLMVVNFPSSLIRIGNYAFDGCKALEQVNLVDGLEFIGDFAFRETSCRSKKIKLPKCLKHYHTGAFPYAKEIFMGDVVETINNTYDSYNNSTNIHTTCDVISSSSSVDFHIGNSVPPKFIYGYSQCLRKCNVYVPPKSISTYSKAPVWQYANIMSEPKPAQSVVLEEHCKELKKGTEIQLLAKVLPDDADDVSLVWSSSDDNIAKVNREGFVTSVSSGEAYIFASLSANRSTKDSCLVKVYQPVSHIQLESNVKSIKVGDSTILIASVSPSDADNRKVSWVSKNPQVASVENGKVMALKAGTAVIVVVSEDNASAMDSCEVHVVQPVTGISLNRDTYTLTGIGRTIQLEANVIPDDASNKTVIWKSSDEHVCVVSNGKVVAVGYGTSVVMAITDDGNFMGVCTIIVNDSTGISPVENDLSGIYKVYTIDGQESSLKTTGVKIIKFGNGGTVKVFVR